VTSDASGGAPGRFTTRELAAWEGFLRTHATVVRDLDAALRVSHGIPLTQFDVLLQLRRHGGRLRMRELAGALMLSRSGLSRLIDQLEERGWVQRRPDASDARGLYAELTDAGRAALGRAQTAHVANVRRCFLGALDPQQIAALAASWAAIASGARCERADETVPP